jgi:hypothetical protein
MLMRLAVAEPLRPRLPSWAGRAVAVDDAEDLAGGGLAALGDAEGDGDLLLQVGELHLLAGLLDLLLDELVLRVHPLDLHVRGEEDGEADRAAEHREEGAHGHDAEDGGDREAGDLLGGRADPPQVLPDVGQRRARSRCSTMCTTLLAETRELAAGLAQHGHAAGLQALAPALEQVVADQHAEQAGHDQREHAAGDEPHRLELEGDARSPARGSRRAPCP